MMYKQDIDDFMKSVFDKHKDLWTPDRDKIIQEFVNTNPLTVDIRDKFVYYDNVTSQLQEVEKRHCIGPIEIRMGTLNCSYYEI